MIKPNQLIAFSSVIALIATVIASSRASNVRVLAERRIPFNFDQHNSIGDKSGE
ncbi:MAG: hypothetical protein RLZZ86_1878 [Cyanobacteriota bacterium]